MKKFKFFTFLVGGVVALAIQNASAGSAVVWDYHRNIEACYGHPLEIAKAKALADARTRGWAKAQIISTCDLTGYGAIAIARRPSGVGYVLGVSLGNPSKKVAVALAKDHCLKNGGTEPKVRYTFKG